MRRMLAMLLCVVMVVGLVPATVFAAGTTPLTAAIFFSDVHEESTGTSGSGTTAMKNVLAAIGQNGVSYETIGLVGDTYSDKAGTMANMTSAAQGALGQTIPCYYAYGDHDEESDIDPDSGLMYTGDYYYIYHISDANMRSSIASQSDISYTDAITNFKNAAASWDKSKILFIMSHVPLHDRRDDNTYANNWYTAITEVAETMDVVFFWAHNHTGEDDVDRAAYYVAKNGSETMTIYGGSTITPNFTYMNAGYIYAGGQDPSRKGVATTVEIYADSMVFQDYNSSGKYTDSSYSHNVTVAREFAATKTLTSLSVSGQTEYYVGDTFVAPTVKAVYSDDSTVTLTAEDYEVSGTYDMNTAGTYTLTYTYEGLTGTYTFAVEPNYVSSIAVTTQPTKVSYLTTDTALDTAGMVVTATYANGTTAAVTGYTLSNVDFTTAGEKTVFVSYTENGTTVTTTFTVTVEEAPEVLTLQKIEITTPPTKTEYLLSEELALDGMVVTATFLNESNETVTHQIAYKPFSTSAVYGGYELDNFSMYVEKAHAMTITYTYGEVTCTATTTINVWAEDFTDEDTSVKVHVSGDYGVTDITVADSENANVATAVADVIKSGTYVAYDISLVFDEGYSETDTTKTVTLPIPEGVTNPVVYYVPASGAAEAMSLTEKTATTVTFETTHFSTYVVGESTEITVPESETAFGSGTTTAYAETEVYVLVSSISEADDYLIASGTSGSVNLLSAASSNGTTNNTATVVTETDEDGNSVTYIADPAEAAIWTASGSSTWTLYNSSLDRYLRYKSGLTTSGSSNNATSWYSTTNALYSRTQSSYTYYYVHYNSGWTATSSSSTSSSYNVYYYQKQTVSLPTTTTVSGTYSIEGEDISAVVASDGSTTATLESTLIFTDEDGNVTNPEMSSSNITYEIVSVDANGNTVNGDPNGIISNLTKKTGKITFSGNYGTALVKVSYETEFGTVTDYITVTATAPYYTIELYHAGLAEAEDVTADNFSEGTYYTYNETTGFYDLATEYVDGTTYYTATATQGNLITDPVALKGIEAGDTYSLWAVVLEHTDDGEEDMGYLGDALSWTVSDTSIATIDTTTGVLTFTGNNYGTFTVTVAYEGADGKVITDTITISATDSLYVVPGDGTDDFPEYPDEGAVRFDKTATAVGNFSETGIAMVEISMTGVPYSTGSEIDVVVMLDMTGSMSDNGMEAAEEATKAFVKMIVQNEDGTYNDNRIAVYAFNSGDNSPYELVALDTIDSDTELTTANTAIDTASDKQAQGGTPYEEATKQCYDILQAAKTTNLPEGMESADDYDRQQFCLFMSDGGPTTYYGSDSKTYYGGNNNSGDVTIASMMTNYTSTTASSWSMDLPTEYYTDLMKADDVTIYTVGLLLQNVPSNPAPWSAMSGVSSVYDSTTDSLTTVGTHYYFTSEILKQMATSTSHYIDIFTVDNAANATAKFQSIAQKIVEAAKDVVVKDKIGNEYSINFSLPSGVTTDETDGLSEFYIQVVEYQLDSNKERTGDPYVKENITFTTDSSGNLSVKSHTIDGVACGTTCSHVTITNNQVTAIDGTYFDYKRETEYDSAGKTIDAEYLTWNEEKISTTELCLQYFAHLDNSSDAVGTNDEIPAGTYYTNEYATLTYTNYNGNQVQQEFPIPQMTWNGAQVSYVFYLVNEHGQPVNRAGKVIPFAEAVYVTDVYTYSVIWNDLEQSAGLEAKYLAEDKVPTAYELYDNGASYNIHVYEDESEVNLNNHFVIGTGFTDIKTTDNVVYVNVCDDNNNYDDLAYTTYVFNNKSDATKYKIAGAYAADDGDDNTNETNLKYLCKGDGTVTATIGEASGVTSENFFNSAYYTKDADGDYALAASYTDDVTYYTITAASYTAASGETQALASSMNSTTGGVVIDGYVYYIDENNVVYTIVQKSNGTEVYKGFDFANTTVAFAVVWKPELVEDTVVVDYGLDVVIDVITNDNMAAGVVGVRADAPSNVTMNSGNYSAAKATSVDVYIDANNDEATLKELKIGTATVENLNSVRFSMDKTNGMQFTEPAVFYYEADVNYYTNTTTDGTTTSTLTTTSMYSSVTVIPATTVYYEDNFVTYEVYTDSDDTLYTGDDRVWTTEGTAQSATQDVDRPGVSKISEAFDADNNYGYDSHYADMTEYSMGSARKLTVDSTYFGKAKFSFYGTGFDLISMTSNQTGTIVVQVMDATGTAVKSKTVDTYYGYTMNADGEWVVSTNEPNAIYQVPVITVEGMEYGKYDVVITIAYNKFFDHASPKAGSYDFYLDAIRIYNPTGNLDTTANSAYVADGEYLPTYLELRDNVIAASNYEVTEDENGEVTVSGDALSGAIFIDSNDATTSIADYVSYGPNNELYLAKGQSVAFNLSATDAADVQLGMKVANGGSVSYSINGGKAQTLETTTDMYYSIMDYVGDTITITNNGDGILSLTNIKTTSNGSTAATASFDEMDGETVGMVLMSLRPMTVEDTEEEVETTEPEVEETEPETTEPEVEETEPETTEPEVEETEPEATEPEVEETEPETTEPEDEDEETEESVAETITNAITAAINKITSALSNLFSKWFR